jgi:hypothetical protein
VDGERMDAAGQLLSQRFMHQPMALQQPQSVEFGRYQDYLEMRLRSWRNVMSATFIDDLQVLKCESGIEMCADLVLDGHQEN